MKIIYFAKIRELIGKSEEEISFPSNVKKIKDLIVFLKNHNKIYHNVFELNQISGQDKSYKLDEVVVHM